MRESTYERELIKKLKAMFPGCHVQKNDPQLTQGIPDILILHGNRWAMLEVKMEDGSRRQPNQEYYVEHFGEMSFVSFINPSTEERVLNELQLALATRRKTRVS
jgi:hypothetical protein